MTTPSMIEVAKSSFNHKYPTGSAITRGSTYVPEIDGLRAIAVLSVMLYHLQASLMPGGFVGVDLFFVISGYVVSSSLENDAARSLPDMLKHFYARRIVRIVPALLVCLLATIAATVLFIPDSWLSDSNEKTALFAFFGGSNFALLGADSYFSPRPEFNPFTHTWSLAVEEQFYIFFPLIFFAGQKFWCKGAKANSAKVLLVGIILISLASFAFLWWISGVNKEAGFYLLPSRFWELGAGVILRQTQRSAGSTISSALRSPHTLNIGAALVVTAMCFADPLTFPFPWALPAVAGAFLMVSEISSGKRSQSFVARFLASAPMVFIGKISYPLYLWHWAIYSLFRWTIGLQKPAYMALALLLSFVLAYLSYILVERPIRFGPWARTWPKSLIIVCGLAAIALSFGTARFAFQHKYRLGSVDKFTQPQAN